MIQTMPLDTTTEDIYKQLATEDERRIYTMFKEEFEPQRLIECIKTAYQTYPTAARQQIIPIIFSLLSSDIPISSGTKIKKAAEKVEYLKPKQWETLQQEDLRFIHSQYLTEYELHQTLKEKYGYKGQVSLNYDLTFVALLLSLLMSMFVKFCSSVPGLFPTTAVSFGTGSASLSVTLYPTS